MRSLIACTGVLTIGLLLTAAQPQVRTGNPARIDPTGKGFELILEQTGEVILTDRHVAEYSEGSHRIRLNSAGAARWAAFVAHDHQFDPPIPKLQKSLAYKWFVLTIDGETIYRGQFRSMVMSSIGKGVQIFDTLGMHPERLSIVFQPGYVLSDTGQAIVDSTSVDPRSDERVFDHFRELRKLK